jgi:release factor glutamine methyltransferase
MPPALAGSVREALEGAIGAIRAAGADTPRLDAELLLAEACDLDRAALAADPGRGVEAAHARRFGAMVRRRVAREPVAYILGRKGFRHLELRVDPRVLIPRPETELLVELALELRPATVLDVGTGSGAIALAVAAELRDVRARGVDTSAGAVEVARANAVSLGLGDRVEIDAGSHSFAYGKEGRPVDLLLANLPYVSDADWDALAPEIRLYEPREALVAGPTGLEAIDGLLGEIAVGHGSIGAIGLEVGAGQAGAVAELVRRAGFETVEIRRDLAGIERVVVGRA